MQAGGEPAFVLFGTFTVIGSISVVPSASPGPSSASSNAISPSTAGAIAAGTLPRLLHGCCCVLHAHITRASAGTIGCALLVVLLVLAGHHMKKRRQATRLSPTVSCSSLASTSP